jgi:hypothetical protein
VDRAGGSGLRLHFDDLRQGSPDILATGGGELVGELAHGRGGRDRVDRDNLAHRVGYMGGRGITVDHDHVLRI